MPRSKSCTALQFITGLATSYTQGFRMCNYRESLKVSGCILIGKNLSICPKTDFCEYCCMLGILNSCCVATQPAKSLENKIQRLLWRIVWRKSQLLRTFPKRGSWTSKMEFIRWADDTWHRQNRRHQHDIQASFDIRGQSKTFVRKPKQVPARPSELTTHPYPIPLKTSPDFSNSSRLRVVNASRRKIIRLFLRHY
jgi:hypothetical protein